MMKRYEKKKYLYIYYYTKTVLHSQVYHSLAPYKLVNIHRARIKKKRRE